MLGQGPLGQYRKPRGTGERVGAEVVGQPLHQRAIAIVVPGDHRRDRVTPAIE
jgi:hypothetical protein